MGQFGDRMKIYFAMSEYDIGCFEWDSIYLDKEKALERVLKIKKSELSYIKSEDERRAYAKEHWVQEAEVIE